MVGRGSHKRSFATLFTAVVAAAFVVTAGCATPEPRDLNSNASAVGWDDGMWVTRVIQENGNYVLVFIGQIRNGIVNANGDQLRIVLGPVAGGGATCTAAVTQTTVGSYLVSSAVIAGKVIIIIGAAIALTAIIDYGINGNWAWEEINVGDPVFWEHFIGDGDGFGPNPGYITVGCYPGDDRTDWFHRCTDAVGDYVVEEYTFSVLTCEDVFDGSYDLSDWRYQECRDIRIQCIDDTEAVCQRQAAIEALGLEGVDPGEILIIDPNGLEATLAEHQAAIDAAVAAEATTCSIDGCDGGTCTTGVCGDGIVEGDEVCDPGVDVDCSSDCTDFLDSGYM